MSDGKGCNAMTTRTMPIGLAALARQLLAVAREIERMPDVTPDERARRARWERAALGGFNTLASGARFTQGDDGLVTFRERARPGAPIITDGTTCGCGGSYEYPCRHMLAARMIAGGERDERWLSALRASTLDITAIDCPYCGTRMVAALTLGGEAVIACGNQRCQKVCALAVVDEFLDRTGVPELARAGSTRAWEVERA